MRLAVATALATVVLAATAVPARFIERPVLFRMEGYVGPKRERPRSIASLTLRHGDTILPFQVSEAWVLSGDAADHDVLHEIEPYTPNLSLAGPPEVVDELVAARPGDPLEVTGYIRLGQRIYTLSSVEPAKRHR
jgi:hypothetical protein